MAIWHYKHSLDSTKTSSHGLMFVNYGSIAKYSKDVRFVSLKCNDWEERLIKRRTFSPPLSEILLAQGIFIGVTGKPGILTIIEIDHDSRLSQLRTYLQVGWFVSRITQKLMNGFPTKFGLRMDPRKNPINFWCRSGCSASLACLTIVRGG